MLADDNHTLKPLVINGDSTPADLQGAHITFSSVNYRLRPRKCCGLFASPFKQTKPKQILYDVCGIFKPGMNAILGPTGCGKSSLLDILADRKDRHGLEGQVLMDGQVQSEDFKYRVGYVVQEDIISGTLTVRENLLFSAHLRLSKNITSDARRSIVEQVIVQLGLDKCADSRVGTEFVRGISGGERKRTNIGMELVLSPSVLFLDEPTTGNVAHTNVHEVGFDRAVSMIVGLDSSTARNVMACLHQLSRRGRKFAGVRVSSLALSLIVFRYDHLFDSSAALLDL